MTQINEALLKLAVWAQTSKDEKGQGLVEYGLIVALVSIVAIGALTTLGTGVVGSLTKVAGSLGG